MKMTEDGILGDIEFTREGNNHLWMKVLGIALRHAPKETKDILRDIRANDLEVSRLTGILADED